MDSRPMDFSPRRRLSCARCDASFDCGLGGDCWCAAEPARLPMPKAMDKPTEQPGPAEDCLCPTCLRAAADIH
jgi:hypothetical protein